MGLKYLLKHVIYPILLTQNTRNLFIDEDDIIYSININLGFHHYVLKRNRFIVCMFFVPWQKA